jgi:ABC-type histidine transport system ATPase subunit
MAPLLQLRALRKAYGALEVLHGISLDVEAGEVVAIIGASGSGKSTLLRCLNLLETPTSGEFVFAGKTIDYGNDRMDWSREARLCAMRAQIGMVFQSYNLWPHMTVLQNIIEAPVRVKKIPPAQAIEHAEVLLKRIGMLDKRDVYPSSARSR